MAITTDVRIHGDCSWPHTLENFNRVLGMIDELAGVVAELEESQLYKVVFDSDGGSAVANQYVIDGEKAIEPEDPTKEDYIFVGWFVDEEEYDFDAEVTGHLILTAHWEEEEEDPEASE